MAMKKIPIMFFLLALLFAPFAFAMDEAGAEALMRKSGCFKCHAVDKKKTGPPYKEVAAKYKGKADAEKKLTTHITTGPKVKVDGEELLVMREEDIMGVLE